MRTRSGSAVRALSLVIPLVGQGVAGVVFALGFHDPTLRPIWLPQFFILLAASTILLLAVPFCRRDLHRVVLLVTTLLLDVVMCVPQGADLGLEATLGTVFVVVTMTEVKGAPAIGLCLACTAALSASHWPIVAWGVRIDAPKSPAIALLASYLCFLTWLAGLVGARGMKLRRQEEELQRIDRTVRALSEANLNFQELVTRVQRETEESERRRLTREIHDIVGYTLVNIQMMMEAATDLVHRDTTGLEEILVKSRDQAQRGLMDTRRAMRNFRAVVEAKSGGLARVIEVAHIFEKATKVTVRLHLGNAPESFGPVIDEVVYRMVQESLTNALRHGNASEITVSFWVIDGELRLSIADNGAGAKEIVPGIGLSGMAERIAYVGGTMRAENSPYGFVVSSEIPLSPREGS
ncbi:MAG TPA: sensor histidine kinase [Spirochaetia bacterium]